MTIPSLYLHCGADLIERDALMALPAPVSRGPRHCPMGHGDYVEYVEDALTQHGYSISESAYGVTAGNNRFFGLMQVKHNDIQAFDGGGFMVGLRGSHDQSLPRGLSAGTRVFVCDNLAFTGERKMTTKQSTNIHQRLPRLMDDMVLGLHDIFGHQLKQVDAYKRTQLTGTVVDAAFTALGRTGVVNWSDMGRVVQEWDAPSHDEHAEEGPSVWRLFNAVTETLKPRNAQHGRLAAVGDVGLVPRTAKLHKLCDQLADVVPMAA